MRKINWKHFLLAALVSLVVILGVIALSYRQPQVMKLSNVEFIDMGDSIINLNVRMAIKNPNFFSISGKDVRIEFTESNTLLGQGNIPSFMLPRSSQSDVDIKMRINFRQVIRSYDHNASDSVQPSVVITGAFMPGFFIKKINLKKNIPKRDVYRLLFNAFRDEVVKK